MFLTPFVKLGASGWPQSMCPRSDESTLLHFDNRILSCRELDEASKFVAAF